MIWVNGQPSETLPATDRGLLYGDGVWETVGVKAGQPQLLGWHLERLQQGLQALAINTLDMAILQREITAFCAHATADLPRAVLKIIVTRGAGVRGYSPHGCEQPTRILQCTPWAQYPVAYYAQGIRLALCETRLAHQPRLAGFKHLNRLEQVLARVEFGSEFQEGLVRDYAGNVIEGTMSNLFVVQADGSVLTPDLTACGIAGVMRRFIVQTLAEWGICCHIRGVTWNDVQDAQALFMTNSLIGIWFVREFAGKQYVKPDLVHALQHHIRTLI